MTAVVSSVPSAACRSPVRRAPADGYTARHLSVLEGLEAVRKRPGMYIGSTDSRGLMHCLWEIIDNAVDEALAGHCTEIDVVLARRRLGRGARRRPRHPGRHRAEDRALRRRGRLDQAARGRQVRRRLVHRHRRPARRRRLGRQRAVGRGSTSRSTATAKIHACPSAAASPGVFDGDGPDARVRRGRAGCARSGKVAKKGVTGTRVRFWPDRQIFTKDAASSSTSCTQRARQTSFLVPGLALTSATSATPPAVTEETFRYDGGISEFCEFLAPDEPVTDVLRLHGTGPLQRDRAGARRQGAHDPAGGRARARRRRRAALGHRLRHHASAPSSTSSPRPRAAPTSPASSAR